MAENKYVYRLNTAIETLSVSFTKSFCEKSEKPFDIPQSATLFGINSSLVLELPVMLLVMILLTIPALVRGRLSRVQGVALLCIYAAFCAVQFTL